MNLYLFIHKANTNRKEGGRIHVVFSEAINFGMSTVMTHKAYGINAEEALWAVKEEALRLEELFSRFISTSDISKINKSAGFHSEGISSETYEVLSRAFKLSKKCDGLFDITIAPLIDIWRDAQKGLKPPKKHRLEKVLNFVDYNDLILNPCGKTAELKKKGQVVDLGGIGKGYAGDKFIEILRKYEITSAFTNIGGNVVALGTKPDGAPWRVGIVHPRKENQLIGYILAIDKAVVTSGDYERYFISRKGRRYHHILNPRTGYPAEAGLISVTVIADNSMDADALSTILFLTGMEEGIKILELFPGVEAVFVQDNLEVYITPGLTEHFRGEVGIEVNILAINKNERSKEYEEARK
jgi:FAD:protein FMN transferase